MRDLSAIKRVVTETIGREFDHIRILDVKIHEDVDSDGDKVLRIDVIFEGTPKDLDAGKLSGVIRHLRPKLEAIHESALPLISFISGADWNRSSGLRGSSED